MGGLIEVLWRVPCLRRVSAGERIVCVEEALDLAPAHPQVVWLITRQADIEGVGEVTLRKLLAVLNTGHQGGAGALHANSRQKWPPGWSR